MKQPPDRWLEQLLLEGVLIPEDWEALSEDKRADICRLTNRDAAISALVEAKLLTTFQAYRLRYGSCEGLVLGNYRLIDRIGAGGMATVFRAEHRRLRQAVAIKVYVASADQDPRSLTRFYTEARAIARLQHPHILHAIDAGEVLVQQVPWHYFVTELIPGRNLETIVQDDGPLDPPQACSLIHQIADALQAAHEAGLIHRDIKPSNIMVTPDGQAKLLDFGLTLAPGSRRVTDPGAILGTVGYIAPEQVRDATRVDARADLFSLGCTLFWALTGTDPFPSHTGAIQDLLRRLNQAPPSARAIRPSLPLALDLLIQRLMDPNPDLRYPSAQAVMGVLYPFWDARHHDLPVSLPTIAESRGPVALPTFASGAPRQHRVLIADDERSIRMLCSSALQNDRMLVDVVDNGRDAIDYLMKQSADLLLLDINMPEINGVEVLRYVRELNQHTHLKVMMFSGHSSSDELARLLSEGADDFLIKPFSIVQLRARVRNVLRLKDVQERSDQLNQHLLAVNSELERNLQIHDGDLLRSRGALVLAVTKLVEQRTHESAAHLLRLQRNARLLCEEAAQMAGFQGLMDETFIRTLEDSIPLHDIGKIALPDYILLKPGRLDAEERLYMEAHTTIGATTLAEVVRVHGFAAGFLQMAVDVARHHHERWDGNGYPDRLSGIDIPLAARITTIVDVYDALRSQRNYKPALSHHSAMAAMLQASEGQFDPQLLQAFARIAPQMERIFREMPN
ncbi:protein kinase domain-containing protein [Tuwongella immobilis]|uniref:Uncharacterized protein n=1 Tax=Tuwongella immobilis TaxID=692036 RepID=A0A6C2YH40_9BACT